MTELSNVQNTQNLIAYRAIHRHDDYFITRTDEQGRLIVLKTNPTLKSAKEAVETVNRFESKQGKGEPWEVTHRQRLPERVTEQMTELFRKTRLMDSPIRRRKPKSKPKWMKVKGFSYQTQAVI